MKVNGTQWHSFAVDKLGEKGKVFLTYRLNLEGIRDDEIAKMQYTLAEKGVSTKIKRAKDDHADFPKGTLYLQISDEESVDNLERFWGERGIELDTHRYDEFLSGAERKDLANRINKNATPSWNSFLAWDLVQVKTKDGNYVTTCRINLDRFKKSEQQMLLNQLAELGISGIERVASAESETVKPNNNTFRVDSACVRKLDRLFVDKPDAQSDWRNLRNWSDRDVHDKQGAKIPYLRFGLDGMSEAEKRHFEESLRKNQISYGIENVGDGDFMRVIGAPAVKDLQKLLTPWTTQGSNVRIRTGVRGE